MHKYKGEGESVGADIFTINIKHYLCIVDYHSTFLVIKHVKRLSADNLIQAYKIILSEYRLPSKIGSDTGTNFISEKFKNLCK